MRVSITCIVLIIASIVKAQGTFKDVVYAAVGDRKLTLDLYLPTSPSSPKLIVWVHGGAWRGGSKDNPPLVFVEHGYALASLDFRLSTEAKFPAQLHDIKAAIRFLRAMAAKYGYNAARIAIAGSSSGGHLACLTGVSNRDKFLEGTEGSFSSQSSDVQAIISYFGATDLTTILTQSTPHGLSVRKPALDLLLGGQPDSLRQIARQASPVFYVDKTDPPLLLLHGDQDPQMPINQSIEMEGAYKHENLDVTFDPVYGSAHGGDAFFAGTHLELALKFLAKSLSK